MAHGGGRAGGWIGDHEAPGQGLGALISRGPFYRFLRRASGFGCDAAAARGGLRPLDATLRVPLLSEGRS
jgi:hypothetical protein